MFGIFPETTSDLRWREWENADARVKCSSDTQLVPSVAVCEDMATTVGDTPRSAARKSTSGPATEFNAIEALLYNAARVDVRA